MTQKTKLTAANGQWVGKKTMMRMEEFIDEIDLLTLLPECKELEFIIHRTMNVPDMPLHKAHGTWNENWFNRTETPDQFTRQPSDSIAPLNLTKLEAYCIDKRTGGMGSHFGFIGTYISMLVSLDDKLIWDARSCDAS